MSHISRFKRSDGALDFVITNAFLIDPLLGIVKCDIGVRDGKIAGIGKAGNPQTLDITPGLIVGPSTDILSVEGKIATPGFVDIPPHVDSPQQLYGFQSAALTTLVC